MAAKAGEIARETTTYLCDSCSYALPVRDGTPIPDCPACGSGSFQTGARTLRNQPPVAAALPGFASFP